MKKQLSKLAKNPMLIVFLIILFIFMPPALVSPGQNRERGVVIAIGIDKEDDEYEISLLTFIPTPEQSYKQMNSVISGKGDTIAKSLYNAEIVMGRKIGLSHAKTTVVNEKLLEDDVSKHIDYLSRFASLSENTIFVCTSSPAKEILTTSSSLQSTVGLQLEEMIAYNAKNLYISDTSLEAFYKGYYSRSSASLIGYLSLTDKEGDKSGSAQSTGQGGSTQVDEGSDTSGGESSSGQGGGSQKQITNNGEAVLIKNGKLVEKLSADNLNGINLLNRKSVNQIITVKDVDYNDNKYDFSYRIKNKKITTATKFENGVPIYSSYLILGLELVEIEGEHERLKINTEFSEMPPQIKEKIDEQIKKQYTEAINILRKNKADVIGIHNKFFRNNRGEYKKFIKDIPQKDDFLNYVNFKINLELKSD